MENRLKHVIPPCASEVELRVISALTQIGDPYNYAVRKAMLLLDIECFYSPDYRHMYEIVHKLFSRKQEFSFVTFITLLPDEIYNRVFQMVKDEYISPNYLESDVKQLLEYRSFRKQLEILVNTVNFSLDALNPAESLTTISEQLRKITTTHSTVRKSYSRSCEVIIDEMLAETAEDNSQFCVDIPHLPPIPNRALITIGGRSGHGKTFFALYLMDKIIDAQQGKQALYFNLEMHEHVMIERLARLLGGKGDTRKEVIMDKAALLLTKNISLISESVLTIDEIESECHVLAMEKPISVIVVDYLGLVRSKTRGEQKHLEQSDIAKRLASLALQLDCVVIALIQVNRDFKTRPVGERCPRPEDSAESMGSVHSAGWWLGIDQPQNDSSDPEWADQFLVACRKNRGDGGLFNLKFKFKFGMFSKFERPFARPKSQEVPLF